MTSPDEDQQPPDARQGESPENPQGADATDPPQGPDPTPGQGATPGQGEGGDAAPDGAARPREFVPVDAAGDRGGFGEDDTPVGQYYGPNASEGGSGEAGPASERFRRASERAREELDERRVPRERRGVIREYFDRIDRRARALDEGPAPRQGKDAPDPGAAEDDGS